MTDFFHSRFKYKSFNRMKASRLPASKLPRSTPRSSSTPSRPKSGPPSNRNSMTPSGRDKPLPSPPVATIVPLTPCSIHATLNDESRPHSPSAASFSRIRNTNTSGLPFRSGAASPLSRIHSARRTSSLLSSDPTTPDSYRCTDEELSGLRNVNRRSREGRDRRPRAGYYQARLVEIAPSRNKAGQDQYSSSPPSTSIHTNPLPTINSEAALPTFDFDDLQPRSPSPAAKSMTATVSPTTPQLDLPPRSDSRAPLMELNSDGSSLAIDDSSQYGDDQESDNFSGTVDIPDSYDDATDTDDHFEVSDGSPLAKGLKRNDSPMGSVMGLAAEDAILRTSTGQEDPHLLPEQNPVHPIDVAVSASHREQELADRIETLPYTTTERLHRIASPQTTMQPPRPVGFGGLAGVNTPGKMRAAAAGREVLQQKSEPNFARRTASSAAKSSAPPDIPRMVTREAQRKPQLPTKGRSVFRRLGGFFRKGQKEERAEKSPIRMRIGRDTAGDKLKAKRQSALTALEIRRSPTPTPSSPHITPEWKPSPVEKSSSQVTLTVASKILPPSFIGERSVSPAADAINTPAASSHSMPQHAQGESTESKLILPIPDGSAEANLAVYNRLLDQMLTEEDPGRQNKFLVLSKILRIGLENVEKAAHWAAEALKASDRAARYADFKEKILSAMQKKALLSMRKK